MAFGIQPASLCMGLALGLFIGSTTLAMSQQVDYERLEQHISTLRISHEVVDDVLSNPAFSEVKKIADRAMAGDMDSQFRLGGCFAKETDVCGLDYRSYYKVADFPQNFVEAAWWTLQAARQGHAGANDALADDLEFDQIELRDVWFPTPFQEPHIAELQARVTASESSMLDKRETLVQVLALRREAHRLSGIPDNTSTIRMAEWKLLSHDTREEQRIVATRKFAEVEARAIARPDADTIYDLAMLYRHAHSYSVGRPEVEGFRDDARHQTVVPDQIVGRPRDKVAATLFSQAAQLGHSGAQYELGRMFYFGSGVAENRATASALYAMAAASGNADAVEALQYEADRAASRALRDKRRAEMLAAGMQLLQQISEMAAFTARVAPSTFGGAVDTRALEDTWFHIGAAVGTDPLLTR